MPRRARALTDHPIVRYIGRDDAERTIAPLKPAQDAIVIDTSNMDASSVFEKIKRMITQSHNSPNAKKSA